MAAPLEHRLALTTSLEIPLLNYEEFGRLYREIAEPAEDSFLETHAEYPRDLLMDALSYAFEKAWEEYAHHRALDVQIHVQRSAREYVRQQTR